MAHRHRPPRRTHSAESHSQRRPAAESLRPAAATAAAPPPPLPAWAPIQPPGRALWILTLVVLALRLVWINADGPWLDEIYVYFDCRRPIWRIFTTLHPLHFLAGRFVLTFSDSAEALRVPTILWATASIPALFLALREFGGSRVAWAGAVLLAASSYQFNYALDDNYYAAMMFWGSVGLLFTIRYFNHAHPMDLALGAGANFAAMGFHPFAGLLTGPSVLLLLARALSSRAARRALLPGPWYHARKPAVATILLLAEVAILYGTIRVLPRIRTMTDILESRLELGATFQNISFGHEFFFDFFARNLTAFSFASPLERSIAWGAVVLMLAGVAAMARRAPWVAALCLVAILGSFALIFNLKAGRFFSLRYLSSLFPLFMTLCAAGGVALAERAAPREWKPTHFSLPRLGSRAAWAILAVYIVGIVAALALHWSPPWPLMLLGWALWIVVAACLAIAALLRRSAPRHIHALIALAIAPMVLANLSCIAARIAHPHPSWKRIQQLWRKQADPNERVVFQGWAELELLRYYLPRSGLSLRNVVRLVDGPEFLLVRLAQLQGIARTTPFAWFTRSWEIDPAPLIREWADRHMQLVEYEESAFGEGMAVRLYTLAIRGRYLNAPYGLRLRYGPGDARRPLPEGDTLWECSIDVDGAATFTLTLPADTRATDADRLRNAKIWMDHSPVATLQHVLDRGLFIPNGTRVLGLSLPGDEPPPELAWNTLNLPGGTTFSARQLTIPFPGYCVTDDYRDRPALRLTRNLGIQYWFDFPTTGTYQLTLEAVHDKGHWDTRRPVWIDVSIDDRFAGILPFDKWNNEWGERSMPLTITRPGLQSLALNLVSAGLAKWNLPPDEETQAILGNVRVRRLRAGESARDERLAVVSTIPTTPRTVSIPVLDESGKAAFPGWIVRGDPCTIAPSAKTLGPRGLPAVEIEVPDRARSILLATPMRPCSPAQGIVQAQALLGVNQLVNQSVTLGILFFASGEASALPESAAFGQEPIVQFASDQHFAVTRPIPERARAYCVVINIYPNGSTPATDPGYILVGGISVGEY